MISNRLIRSVLIRKTKMAAATVTMMTFRRLG